MSNQDPSDARSRAELERAWGDAPARPRDEGQVELIVLRKGDGVHEVVDEVEVSPERGVHGDRWEGAGKGADTQVTLMDVAVARAIQRPGQPLDLPGDNFLVHFDLAAEALPAGARLRLGEALLEVSATPHTGCKKFRQRFGLEALAWIGEDDGLRLRGINCSVVEAGLVRRGDAVRPQA